MVAADDGAGGDDKIEDSCNGNEATTAAVLVSQMGAGEPMQVDGDGNFVLPQVDGPIDTLLSEDEEKMDLDDEPATESATEPTNIDEPATVAEDEGDIQTENVQAKESTIKEEAAVPEAATADLPESITPADEVSKEADNPDNETGPIETNANDTGRSSEKEIDIKTLNDEAKTTKLDLPSVQSPAETPAEQPTALADADPTTMETDETQQDDSSLTKDVKLEPYSAENEKFSATENLSVKDTDTSRLPKDETQEVKKIKDEKTESKTANLPVEGSFAKSEDASEPMIADDNALTATDAVNVTPVTIPIVTPSIQMKLEPADESSMEQDSKSTDLPISSINGVALPLEKETEGVPKGHTPVKIEVKDELLASSKRESLKQEKLNDTRSETGDDSTALTTLATAALGSAEQSPIKIKSEQVDSIVIYCIY